MYGRLVKRLKWAVSEVRRVSCVRERVAYVTLGSRLSGTEVNRCDVRRVGYVGDRLVNVAAYMT